MKRRVPTISVALALVACATLAGCGKKAGNDNGKAQAAGGEVLPGTVSDAMIDLDRSQAEAPLQAPKPGEAAKAGAAAPVADASAAADQSAPDATPGVPAPAAGAAAPEPKPATSATPKPASTAKPAVKPTPKPLPKPSPTRSGGN
ncbi:hypothetical protein [Novosphingobium sp. MD-1]|uniref:hypothetical protein n=1 Tax=Novosphingobium sp. MD-1 TaxID=1630648 RepID=UPI00061BBB63|nr:hypothetical protein [Novosphingobium sp. MD-1]GAO54327.1 proline-rich protein [Novosphingobium sp. MD-1]